MGNASAPRMSLPDLGFGVGLRRPHWQYVLAHRPPVDWFEVITENFLDSNGWSRRVLEQVRERYPVAFHGVSLSVGSTAPLDFAYLAKLKQLADDLEPAWVSDHLCWTGVNGRNTHELLPLVLNEESLCHVVRRVRIVQDYLERPLILENPSSYVSFEADTLCEWEFLATVAEEADCGLLVDVNNVFVSAHNHAFDAYAYLASLPTRRIAQFHLAGHTHCGSHILDTHDHPVCPEVWNLFSFIWRRTAGVSTLIEWDDRIPEFETLREEAERARACTAGSMRGIGPEPAPALDLVVSPIALEAPST